MNDLESKRHAAADVIAHPTSIAQTRQNASLPKFSPLSLPHSVAAAADRGNRGDESDEEGEEIATPAFNVDKLKAETKTPFRTVGGAVLTRRV